MLHIANKWILTIFLFLFVTAFFPVPESTATTYRVVYADAPGTGFYDQTPLTDQMARGDIRGTTLGEVRRTAFENALDILREAIRTQNNGGIIIQASFEDLGGPNPGGGITLAQAGAAEFAGLVAGPGGSISPPSLNEPGVLAMPVALAEHFAGQGLNGSKADVVIQFNESESLSFYYGTGSTPSFYVNFTVLTAHELLHGLGFLSLIEEDGSFQLTEQDGSMLPVFSHYDLNLFSESEEDLFVNLSQSERQDAITSVDGLLWDGTLGGLFTPSCAQLMGEALMNEYPSAADSEGRPRLYAPDPWEPGSSVSHLAEASKDLMKPSYEGAEHVNFTLGLLLDMLWVVGDISPTQSEVLEGCLADSGEEPEPEPEPKPEPTAGSGGGGGGCTIAESQNTQQNAMFNLFLILCALFPVLFYTNSMIKFSSVQGFSKK